MRGTATESATAAVMDLLRTAGVLRPRDLSERGIDPKYLDRLYRLGLVERIGRGLYRPADAMVTEHHSLVEVAKRVPRGVVCLLSALRFHEVGTQNPFEVWLTLGVHDRAPRAPELPLRIVRASGDALHAGVKEHDIEGVPVKIYCPAKTVADCFKYRNKIGLDVALEALQEIWRSRKVTMDELFHYAQVCNVTTVMRPYLEAVVA